MELFSREGIDYSIEDCSVGDIFNYNEILVLQTMRKLYKENSSQCHCPICIEDLFALSLNNLPPRYIQITSIEKYVNSKNFVDEKMVREKVLEACKKINKKPGH